MAEEVKKAVKAKKSKIDDKAAAVRAPSSVQKAGEKAVTVSPKVEAVIVEPEKATAPGAKPDAQKAEPVKMEPVKASSDIKTEAPKAEIKKEADPSKEFVDSIITEMALKGGSKKRLIKKLAEQFNFDRQRVMFKLKRALISERYAAAHAEAGH